MSQHKNYVIATTIFSGDAESYYCGFATRPDPKRFNTNVAYATRFENEDTAQQVIDILISKSLDPAEYFVTHHYTNY
jgi:hypothetical protein